jgi:hypothetical protein
MLRYVAGYTMLPELITAVGRCYLAVPAVYVLRWPLAGVRQHA